MTIRAQGAQDGPGADVDASRVDGEQIFEVDGLAVGFDDGPDVLQAVTMSITRGEFVSLLGPSGCGKTTILNVAAGLLSPRAGTVRFLGRPIHGVNTDVGYMTQDDTLLPWSTVEVNIGLPLRMRKVARPEIAERVDRLLDLLDLRHAARMYPGQLSGGMRRRALLARSMIYEPKLLLMDEPFAALDAQMRHEMHQELRSTVRRLDQTVMFVTHDISEAAKISDRVLVVGGGPPGRIVHHHHIPFGGERDLDSIRFTDEYAQVELELDQALRAAKTRVTAGSHTKGGTR